MSYKLVKKCVCCGYTLEGYDKECDTCGACIDNGETCSCGEKAVKV